MADNTTLNTGTGGDVIATDDIGGVKHQRVKVEYGADGSATDVSAATPLPVAQLVKLAAYGTKTDVLTTELNSLANNANTAASSAYDNSSNLYPWCDVIVVVAAQGSARSAGAMVAVYMTTRSDGTNFDDVNETTAELVAVMPLDAATTARRRTIRRVGLPPEQVKFFARNLTGQALAASGSTVSVRPYYDAGA